MTMSDWLSPNPPRIADPLGIMRMEKYNEDLLNNIIVNNWFEPKL